MFSQMQKRRVEEKRRGGNIHCDLYFWRKGKKREGAKR